MKPIQRIEPKTVKSINVKNTFDEIKHLEKQRKVKVFGKNELQPNQEMMILIEDNNMRINIRIETHPFQQGGVPIRHMNIQIWILSQDKINQINNLHIPLD